MANYVQFDADTEESLRTITFEEDQYKLGNEYNISVFNTDGTPNTDTLTGMVNFEAYSPGADQPESPSTPIDLSTDCRKWTLFFSTISRVVFSVTNLTANKRVIATAIRSKTGI